MNNIRSTLDDAYQTDIKEIHLRYWKDFLKYSSESSSEPQH